ncbi:MAG: tetratricopeptide repeat protein, partial [Prevotella sp.]|nr:tetratricopeptide repeat protein [Prevotella sp.]
MDLERLINHPELLDKETLYDLRSLLALYPYFQTARLLLLKNLFLLHDPTFDEELRRSAVYITDRKVIFDMVEAAHYKLPNPNCSNQETASSSNGGGDRTITLIDQFLDSLPVEQGEEGKKKKSKRKPTPVDATIDYVSYLLETEGENGESEEQNNPAMKGQDLIDNFIQNDKGKIQLKDEPEYVPEDDDNGKKEHEDEFYTETLAQIYIRQERYSKALEIIKRLNLNNPKKNIYFADQ